MRSALEQIAALNTVRVARGLDDLTSRRRNRLQQWSENPSSRPSHATFSSVAVMLRLRFRYVSKAAILKLPVQPVPVENRSSS